MPDEPQKTADIETLARMAARLAGRDPDEHFRLRLARELFHDGPAWSYVDFMKRAEAAYALLECPTLP
jgi:hypothetical protein